MALAGAWRRRVKSKASDRHVDEILRRASQSIGGEVAKAAEAASLEMGVAQMRVGASG